MAMSNKSNRRSFLKKAGVLGVSAYAIPQFIPSKVFGAEAPSSKLNIACIGLGGQMHGLMKELNINLHQYIVAVCDVDENRMELTTSMPELGANKAHVYSDYRELLAHEDTVDAVVIATPDHWHAEICSAFIKAGKHVYCEKPLTHTVAEARAIRQLSKEYNVVTQVGNQGASSDNFRRSIELIQAGVLGSVNEIHIWHPQHGWPNGIERPSGQDTIPEGFNWDFWLGKAPSRPYKDGNYHPGAWRGWFDFGGGSLADFCCHSFSMPVRALNLDYPEKIEVSGDGLGKESFPKSCRLKFHFPARGSRGQVTIFFYSGNEVFPPSNVTKGIVETFGSIPTTGCLLVGDNATLQAGLWNEDCYLNMKEEVKFRHWMKKDAAKSVPFSLPRLEGSHVKEWVEACKGDGSTFSNFDFGGHVTEIGNAGLVALRLGRNIEWDGRAMKVKEVDASHLVNPEPRPEWNQYKMKTPV